MIESYYRIFLRTQEQYVEKFNEFHAQEVSVPFFEGEGIPEVAALKLVNKWNRISNVSKYFLLI
jgi:hypothetical protein